MLLFACSLEAGQYRVQHLGANSGLSEGHVYALLEDHMGFMWIATRDGLNRYDGYNMKVYRNHPGHIDSLSSNYIYSLYEDRLGRLWVGTRGGLNLYRREQDSFLPYTHQKKDSNSLTHNTVFSMIEDQGLLWVGTGGGLNLFDPDTGQFRRFLHEPNQKNSLASNDIRDLCITHNRHLWIATRGGGLHRMNLSEIGKFQRYSSHQGIDHNQITQVMQDSQKRLWVGSVGGLYRMDDPKEDRFRFVTTQDNVGFPHITGICQDQDNFLWLTTMGGGLYRFNIETGEARNWRSQSSGEHQSLPLDTLNTVYQDRAGILWVGTYGRNISLLSSHPFDNLKSGAKVVSMLKTRAGELWLGQTEGGLRRIDSQNQTRIYSAYDQKTEPEVHNQICALLEDRQGRLWAGSFSGLHHYLPDEDRFIRISDRKPSNSGGDLVFSLHEDPRGGLWLATYGGLKYLPPNREPPFIHYQNEPDNPQSLSDNKIVYIYGDPQDGGETLWIGTRNGGLNRMNLNRPGFFSHYQHEFGKQGSLSDNGVTTMLRDHKGRFWVGTSGGLNLLDPDSGRVQSFFIQDGLMSNAICHILQDHDNRLWVSTVRGLSLFNPDLQSFANYDHRDGIALEGFQEHCGFVDTDGRVYFGGTGGIISFNPQMLFRSRRSSNIQVTHLLVDKNLQEVKTANSVLNQAVEITEAVFLPEGHRSLELRFSTLDFMAPDQSKYAFRLDGFDPEWTYTGADDRRAAYTNLDPGVYEFRVKGKARGGAWSAERSVILHVPTPIWRRWWALCFYVMCVAGIILGYFTYQKRVQYRLELKVSERTKDLEEAQRQLVEAAHYAGMAESAVNVLHSMGNALNSVHTSVQLIRDRCDNSMLLSLFQQLIQKTQERSITEQQLQAALTTIHTRLKRRSERLDTEIDALTKNTASMRVILDAQHEYTHGQQEPSDIYDLNFLIKETCRLATHLNREKRVKLYIELEEVPSVALVKTKFTRVLLYLLNNAWDAIDELNVEKQGSIRLHTWYQSSEVMVEISDNGIGIQPELQALIFAQGYTTKNSNRGFGLHYCANAMKEMKGWIKIKSDGQGLGTTVTLGLPMAQVSRQNEKYAG